MTNRRDSQPQLPSEVDEHVGLFDRFAGWVSDNTARAWFFAACVLLVVLWAPTLLFLNINTSQLLINTATTIVTFLLVALLQNTQKRDSGAIQKKLNAVADGLADLMEHTAKTTRAKGAADMLRDDIVELRAAVGLEQRESTS